MTTETLNKFKAAWYGVLILFLCFIGITIQNSFSKIEKVSKELREELKISKKEFTETLSTQLKYVDSRSISLENKTFSLLKETQKEVSILRTDLSKTIQSSDKLIRTYEKLPSRFENKFASHFDCDTNEFCLQNVTTDTLLEVKDSAKNSSVASGEIVKISKEITETSKDFSKDFRQISKDVQLVSGSLGVGIPKVVENTTKITDNIERLSHPKWWERVLSYGISGAAVGIKIR